MGDLKAALKRYYRSIRKELPCPWKMKKQIMQQIHDSVNLFLKQNPTVDFQAVQTHFGEPQAIALSYIEDQDAPELLRRMRVKKRVFAVAAGALAVAILIWGAIVICAAIDAKNTYDGYIAVDIEED